MSISEETSEVKKFLQTKGKGICSPVVLLLIKSASRSCEEGTPMSDRNQRKIMLSETSPRIKTFFLTLLYQLEILCWLMIFFKEQHSYGKIKSGTYFNINYFN